MEKEDIVKAVAKSFFHVIRKEGMYKDFMREVNGSNLNTLPNAIAISEGDLLYRRTTPFFNNGNMDDFIRTLSHLSSESRCSNMWDESDYDTQMYILFLVNILVHEFMERHVMNSGVSKRDALIKLESYSKQIFELSGRLLYGDSFKNEIDKDVYVDMHIHDVDEVMTYNDAPDEEMLKADFDDLFAGYPFTTSL